MDGSLAQPTKVPERLWKYKPWDEWARRLVELGEIHFSTVEQLNDPFEFRWHDSYPCADAEQRRYVKEMCARQYPNDTIIQRRVHFQHLLGQLRELASRGGGTSPTVAKMDLGVFSASVINDDILMWSHYARNHEGICVGILTRVMNRLFLPVQYVDHVPCQDAWVYIYPDRNQFVRLSTMKFRRWEYEQEWRSIYRAGPKTYPGCINCVIIGVRATDKTRQEVREAVAGSGQSIEIIDARLSDREYAVETRPKSPSKFLPKKARPSRKSARRGCSK